MTTLEVYFQRMHKDDLRVPYICEQDTIKLICDGKEGSLCFDGYYYVEDHAPPYSEDEGRPSWVRRDTEYLPKTLKMTVKRSESEPYKREVSGGLKEYYKVLEHTQYIVEIYKRVLHESTDRMSEVDDGDGETMQVCFFPTYRQTIYFRVLDAKIDGGTNKGF